ncbi:MAG TPA: M50 family metallopeptidase [Microbacteriaceae bacterium]|nr:M50 family metallopeptidase [Microbacteriaceae bacterium]
MESVLNYILGVLVVLIGLAVSIGLHEIGHLVPAKLFGIRVTQYMIGFGPTLWSRRRGETEYGIKLLPLGGYISMVGMYIPAKPSATESRKLGYFRRMIQDAREHAAEGLQAGDETRMFVAKPVWQRIIVMLGGPFMNLALAVVLFGILLMVIGVPERTTTIRSVLECVPTTVSSQAECTSDDEPSPAKKAGFTPGDVILDVNGQRVDEWSEFTTDVAENPGETLLVTVERAGREMQLKLTPVAIERADVDSAGREILRDGKPVMVTVGYAGLSTQVATVRKDSAAVLSVTGATIGETANLITHLPQKIAGVVQSTVSGEERDPNGPISVVGIGAVAGEVVSASGATVEGRVSTLIGMIASLNIALFLFNLIPLLPLDGGHVAAALWEAVRRGFARALKRPDPGPVDTAKFVPVTFAIVILLVSVSAVLIWADIVNPVSLFG